MAISCVLASRRAIGIIPILSERMKEMTLLDEGYHGDDGLVFEEIGECYELVCNLQRGGKKLLKSDEGNSGGQQSNSSTVRKQQYLTAQKPGVKSQISTCDRTP